MKCLWPFGLISSLLFTACVARQSLPVAARGATVPVYVVNHGKHAGLAVRRGDIPQGLWPESADFPGADFLEVGWGDRDYYQITEPGIWITLKAALWPTHSVLHVVGIRDKLSQFYPGAEIIRLDLCQEAYLKLIKYIHLSFDRRVDVKVRPLRRGYYPFSWFYPATGRFHLFHTCNGWIANVLEAAGLPMGWPLPVTSEQLMSRIRKLPEIRSPVSKCGFDPEWVKRGSPYESSP